MERLRQRDVSAGATDKPPSEAQKAAIAEARSIHAAKVAELEILQRSKMAGIYDPEERERLSAEYRGEIRRLNDDCERKIQRIRSGA